MSQIESTPPAPLTGAARHSLGEAIERLRHRWGWIVALGVLNVAFGLIALALVGLATLTSVYTIGFMMILAGGAEIAMGFGSATWGRVILWIIGGLLYIAAGAVAIAQPVAAASFITLFLGAGLLATGVVRLILAFRLPANSGRPIVIFSSFTTIALGLIIVAGWPNNSVFVLGLLLGIDLVFYGAGWIGFGLRIRQPHVASRPRTVAP